MLKYNFENKKITAVLITAAGILLISLIAWVGVDVFNKIKTISNAPAANTITISATSEVYAKPDLAITTFSVVTEAKTVGKAMQDNATKMNEVIAFVKSQGVEEKDLKTTNFNVSPRYEWDEEWRNRTLVGYEVTQSLQVKMRDLAKIGDIIQGATDAGANEMGDLQFTIDNEDSLKEEVRAKAIEEAKTKAKTLAGQLGIKLVKIISFSENGVMPIYYPMTAKSSEALGMGGGTTAPDIQTGENKITVTVSLTYQIR